MAQTLDLTTKKAYQSKEVLNKVLNTGGDALKVDIEGADFTGATLEVELDKDNDSVLSYGNTVKDGSGTSYSLLVDADGKLITAGAATVTGIVSGRHVCAAAGTPDQFPSQAMARVDMTAETSNTGLVLIGDASVDESSGTRAGVPLEPGDSYSVEIDNLNALYIDSKISGDGVSYNCLTT